MRAAPVARWGRFLLFSAPCGPVVGVVYVDELREKPDFGVLGQIAPDVFHRMWA